LPLFFPGNKNILLISACPPGIIKRKAYPAKKDGMISLDLKN